MIEFVTLSNYTSPSITENPQKKWVEYGEGNNYFEYLLDRYRGSPTNHAIINGVADSIIGNGLTSADAANKPQDYMLLKRLFKDDDLRRWAFDLKCYGFYVQQIIMDEALENIVEVKYTPVQNWRSGIADEEGNIDTMWYSDDWMQTNKKQYKPQDFPTYNHSIKRPLSILAVKPYRSGSFYYPSVDYQGALQYAHIEEEISNFHLNNIMNGLSPAMLVNFNNGDPGEEKRKDMERNIQNKWGGTSNAGKYVLAFNDSKEEAATIEPVAQPDLDKQYQFLSEESTKKIMVGHRITSPLFFGIRDSSGLGSNADEIKNAWLLYERTVLKSYRILMLNNITFLLGEQKNFLDVGVESNTPIEFEMSNELYLQGEEIDLEEWELVHEQEVNYDEDDRMDRILLASVPSSSPTTKSEQDTDLFKVRYVYSPGTTSFNTREFCKKMVSAKKVYRKEDIIAAGDKPVNRGWGLNGADTYSIWLYKGGGNCHHFWMRQTYVRKNNKRISVNEARRMILQQPPDERERLPVNDTDVAKRPTDMPKHGFVNKN